MNVEMPLGFEDLINRLAQTRAAEMPQPKRRKRLLTEAEDAVKAGRMPALLEFQSSANYTYNRHAAELHRLAVAGFAEELGSYQIGGTNTYAKALREYQRLLLLAVAAVDGPHTGRTNSIHKISGNGRRAA